MEGLEIEKKDNIGIISFQATSICNTEKIGKASEEIENFVSHSKPKYVIFDFEKVKFFSSQVLGLILSVRAKLKEIEGEVVISSIDPQLYRVFRITNLDRIFRFFSDKDSALEELSVNN